MRHTRRDFLKTSLGAAVLAGTGAAIPARAAAKKASDWVTLGKSGIKVTRLAFGTGTFAGRVQRELGQEGFTRLVRHAYDRGIRFFETADAYRGMPQMLGIALKGLPRDSYRLMTKCMVGRPGADPKDTVQRLVTDLNTEYVDIMLLHCLRTPDWAEQFKPVRDAFSEAKVKKVIMAHGASAHGLLPVRNLAGKDWLDVALLRTNHNGVKMDTMSQRDTNEIGDVKEVTGHIKTLHDQGVGVLGMKLIGEGQFTNIEDREAAMKFVLGLGTVDAFTIGFKSPEEVDETVDRIERLGKA